VIVVLVALWIALTTTKPLGTNENGRNDWCTVLFFPRNQHNAATGLHQK
jgi:hypothetical protein